MLRDLLYNVKFLLMFAVLLVLPMHAFAGGGHGGSDWSFVGYLNQTEVGSWRQVAFFDARERETLIQITNTSTKRVEIHVQLFDVNEACGECDFTDELTPGDTVVYNPENLVRNVDGASVTCSIPDGGHGLAVISAFKCGPKGNLCDDNGRESGPLIGMFRIIDEAGYEYRTNTAGIKDSGFERDDGWGPRGPYAMAVNYNQVNNNDLSDLVGMPFVQISEYAVLASADISVTFGDQNDGNPILSCDYKELCASCSDATFACGTDASGNSLLDRAVDRSLPNSKGDVNQVCGTRNIGFDDGFDAGWLYLPLQSYGCDSNSGGVSSCNGNFQNFVGFIGLNNGDGTGSMDSWELINPQFGKIKRAPLTP